MTATVAPVMTTQPKTTAPPAPALKKTVAIITTTIGVCPPSYLEWAKYGTVIVAGDRNTPPATISYIKEKCDGVYLSVVVQQKYAFSEILGWRTIQRRNAAIMYAYAHQYDIIITVDDDNFPVLIDIDDIAAKLYEPWETGSLVLGTSPTEQWYNIGEWTSPKSWQRGTPYADTSDVIMVETGIVVRTPVLQFGILGEPDTDAIHRLAGLAPEVLYTNKFVIDPGSLWFAFNSQATAYTREMAPFIAVLPGVGRFDDILSSYITQHVLAHRRQCVGVNQFLVRQTRNEHNLQTDLRQEINGLKIAIEFRRRLASCHLADSSSLVGQYWTCINAVADLLPRDTVQFMRQWTKEWKVNT